MDKFYENLYYKYGEKKFLIIFAIMFSIAVNILATAVLVTFMGTVFEPVRIAVYTLLYVFVGIVIGKMRVSKIKGSE